MVQNCDHNCTWFHNRCQKLTLNSWYISAGVSQMANFIQDTFFQDPFLSIPITALWNFYHRNVIQQIKYPATSKASRIWENTLSNASVFPKSFLFRRQCGKPCCVTISLLPSKLFIYKHKTSLGPTKINAVDSNFKPDESGKKLALNLLKVKKIVW